MPTPQIFVDLRRSDDDSHVGLVTYAQYRTLPSQTVADTTPNLFVRSQTGRRVDLGTLAELVRALDLGADYSRRAAAQ